VGKRVYEQKTYLETTGRGFFGTIGNIVKWLLIIGVVIIIIGALT
jgi:hypothetical protein